MLASINSDPGNEFFGEILSLVGAQFYKFDFILALGWFDDAQLQSYLFLEYFICVG